MVFVSELQIAREGMLHAYDEGMINGDYAFIMFELDQSQVSIYSKHPFKWYFSGHQSTLNRYAEVVKACEAAFVLAVKSPSLASYSKFKDELKKRSIDPPFYSKRYKGYLWGNNVTGTKFLANSTQVRATSLNAVIAANHCQLST